MKADSQRLRSIIRKIFAFQNIWSTLEKILHLQCSVYALEKKNHSNQKKNLHHLWFLHCALNLIFLSVMTVCLPLLQPHIDWNNTFCIGISHLTVEFLSHLEFLKILTVTKTCWGRTFWHILTHWFHYGMKRYY